MEVTNPPSASSSNRNSTISSSDINNILSQANSTAAQPSPVAHISSSRPTSSGVTSATHQSGQPFPTASDPPFHPVVRPNRFSLTFPILPPSKEESPVRRSISPTRDIVQQATELLNISADPNDGNFLTAIAAQERCVLEIKEELHKAEVELDRLKLLWATHEAQKKKSESRKTTRMRPLSLALPSNTNVEDLKGGPLQQQQELERRRALLAASRTSRGTVFSGSRHTRTLSLLAPPQKTKASSATVPVRARRDTSPDKTLETAVQPGLIRASTTPDLATEEAKKNDIKLDLSELGIDRDMMLNTGKKMAMGIKDGLWTFWEDLRQATVGEDMVQIIPPEHLKSQSSTQTLRGARRGGSTRGSSRGSNSSIRSGEGKLALTRSPTDKRSSPKRAANNLPPLVDTSDKTPLAPTEAHASPRRTPTTSKRASKHSKAPSVAISTASSDAWDGWDDSPGFSRSSSATSQSTSHLSPALESQSTPSKVHRSAEPAPASDPLPWPVISKFPGATLRRTASHLMSEWDKLEPRKDKSDSGAGNGLGPQGSVKQD